MCRAGGTSPFKHKCPERLLTAKSRFAQLRRAGLFRSRLGSPALLAFRTPRLTTLLERTRKSIIFRCLPSSASVATTALGTQESQESAVTQKSLLERKSESVESPGLYSRVKWTREKAMSFTEPRWGFLKLRLANLR